MNVALLSHGLLTEYGPMADMSLEGISNHWSESKVEERKVILALQSNAFFKVFFTAFTF